MACYLYILYDVNFVSKKYYVGISNNPEKRLKQHIKIKNENKFKDYWINKIVSNNSKINYKVFAEFNTENEAGQAEISLIAFLKFFNIELTNVAVGGNSPPEQKGESNFRSKITNQDAFNIRKQYIEKKFSTNELCKKYNLQLSALWKIVRNTSYTDSKIEQKEHDLLLESRIKEDARKTFNNKYERMYNKKIKQVEEIRKKYFFEDINSVKLAKEYKLSVTHIMRIVKYQTYNKNCEIPKDLKQKIHKQISKNVSKVPPNRKLNEKLVKEIRTKYFNNKCSRKQLAHEFNIDKSVIDDVVNYKSWNKSIEIPENLKELIKIRNHEERQTSRRSININK